MVSLTHILVVSPMSIGAKLRIGVKFVIDKGISYNF